MAEDISDLSFKVANPPLLKLELAIWLNNIRRTDFTIDAGTVKLKDAFKAPGKYVIRIAATLYTEANNLFKTDTVRYFANKSRALGHQPSRNHLRLFNVSTSSYRK